jgi:hypothetical protein
VLYGLSPDVGEHSGRSRTCLSEAEVIRLAEETLNNVVWSRT